MERDGSENPALRLQRQAFLGFNRRVQSGRPAPVLRDAAFEFVHGFDGAVFHQVIHVSAQQRVGVEGILNGGEQREVLLGEQIAAAERSFDGADAGVGKRDVPGVFIEREMAAAAEESRDAIHLISQRLLRPLRRPRSPEECELHR